MLMLPHAEHPHPHRARRRRREIASIDLAVDTFGSGDFASSIPSSSDAPSALPLPVSPSSQGEHPDARHVFDLMHNHSCTPLLIETFIIDGSSALPGVQAMLHQILELL